MTSIRSIPPIARTSSSADRAPSPPPPAAALIMPACVITQSARINRAYQPRMSSTLSWIACPSPMPLLTATTSTPVVSAVRTGWRRICSRASSRSMRKRRGTSAAQARAIGGRITGVIATNDNSIAIPAGTAARGGSFSRITRTSIAVANAHSTSAAPTNRQGMPGEGGGGALASPSSGSTAAACRAGHHAAATATTIPISADSGMIAGWTTSPVKGAWSEREIPAAIGRAAARPAATPIAAPTAPSSADSMVIMRRICRPLAPRRRTSDNDRRRSVTFMSMALPTMNQLIATVRPVTKSSPRSAECMTSSAMPARPAGTSAMSVSGRTFPAASTNFFRSASGVRATRTRSTSPRAFDMSSSAPMSRTTPAPSPNHRSDVGTASPSTVIRRTPRRAKKRISSSTTLPRLRARFSSRTTSSIAVQARPDESSSIPMSTNRSASTPTAISRTRFSPTRSSVGR